MQAVYRSSHCWMQVGRVFSGNMVAGPRCSTQGFHCTGRDYHVSAVGTGVFIVLRIPICRHLMSYNNTLHIVLRSTEPRSSPNNCSLSRIVFVFLRYRWFSYRNTLTRIVTRTRSPVAQHSGEAGRRRNSIHPQRACRQPTGKLRRARGGLAGIFFQTWLRSISCYEHSFICRSVYKRSDFGRKMREIFQLTGSENRFSGKSFFGKWGIRCFGIGATRSFRFRTAVKMLYTEPQIRNPDPASGIAVGQSRRSDSSTLHPHWRISGQKPASSRNPSRRICSRNCLPAGRSGPTGTG